MSPHHLAPKFFIFHLSQSFFCITSSLSRNSWSRSIFLKSLFPVRHSACLSPLFPRVPPGGMRVPSSRSNLLPHCNISFTANSIRLTFEAFKNAPVAVYLPPISPIANLTSLSALLNNRKISSIITPPRLATISSSPLNRLYHLITFLWLFSPLISPNPNFSRCLHRHVCSSRRHVADLSPY